MIRVGTALAAGVKHGLGVSSILDAANRCPPAEMPSRFTEIVGRVDRPAGAALEEAIARWRRALGDFPRRAAGELADHSRRLAGAPGTATDAVDGGATVPLELDGDAWLDLVRRIGATQPATRHVGTYLTGDPSALPALPGEVDVRTTPQRAASLMLPGGPCPVVRVGDIPYGILPVASREAQWQAASDDPAIEPTILRRAENAAAIDAHVAPESGTAAGADAAGILKIVTRGFNPAVLIVGIGDPLVLPTDRVRRDALRLDMLADLAFLF